MATKRSRNDSVWFSCKLFAVCFESSTFKLDPKQSKHSNFIPIETTPFGQRCVLDFVNCMKNKLVFVYQIMTIALKIVPR